MVAEAIVKKISASPPPPWEALHLVAQFLDPKSLAVCSCVSKLWREAMYSDHLWLRLLLSNYPSAAHLNNNNNSSPKQLFAVFYSASSHRRRRGLASPRISLANLVFAIDVFDRRRSTNKPVLSIAMQGNRLSKQSADVFHFEIDDVKDSTIIESKPEELSVVWTILTEGYRGAFNMIDSEAKGRSIGPTSAWFSEELPGPACCSAAATPATGSRGMVAEVGLEFARLGDGMKKRVEKVRIGMMEMLGCRYVCTGTALLYLQSYLLPQQL